MNIGLVVSGGMAKGAYEIGALRALSELLPLEEIKYISGASIGVINSFGFATEQLDLGVKLWRDICSGNTRYFITQILKSSMLQNCLVSLVEAQKPLKTNLFTTLYDATQRTVVYKNLAAVDPALLRQYLQASVAMPIYNKAVKIEGTSYYDGAMIDNIPVFPLTELDLDYIICIYFDAESYKFESPEFDSKVVKLTFPVVNMVKQSVVFEQESVEQMVSVGYEHTKQVLAPYFKNGWQDADTVLAQIAEDNKTGPARRFRITGDLIVTNLNKVAIKFARRKIVD